MLEHYMQSGCFHQGCSETPLCGLHTYVGYAWYLKQSFVPHCVSNHTELLPGNYSDVGMNSVGVVA